MGLPVFVFVSLVYVEIDALIQRELSFGDVSVCLAMHVLCEQVIFFFFNKVVLRSMAEGAQEDYFRFFLNSFNFHFLQSRANKYCLL